MDGWKNKRARACSTIAPCVHVCVLLVQTREELKAAELHAVKEVQEDAGDAEGDASSSGGGSDSDSDSSSDSDHDSRKVSSCCFACLAGS